MDNFCRGCLNKYEPMDLFEYTEKNRRLFVYSTGLQVKRNYAFAFQLCKECCISMKNACNFKKTCRDSDKRIKSYLENKESGDNTDFITFLKYDKDSLKLSIPLHAGSSTPHYDKNKDDDNESTCTSIQNFMTDILPTEEIPDTEARIICEVIEEEADILEDSLDSHWLQEEVSIDSDFKLDYNFSPFSTPHSINNDSFSCLQKIQESTEEDDKLLQDNKNKDNLNNEKPISSNLGMEKAFVEFDLSKSLKKENVNKYIENKCVIDSNLENALKNSNTEKVMLYDIILTPPVLQNISSPPTPLITNILFGEKMDDDITNKGKENKINMCHDDIDVLDEFLELSDSKQETIEYEDSLIDIEEIENIQNYLNKEVTQTKERKATKLKTYSPIENKFSITNFYCKMCERQFKNLVALKVHCTKHHKFKIEMPKKKRVRKQYICDHCGKVFMSSRCVTKHLATHQTLKTYECIICNIQFSSQARLDQHSTTHTGVRVKKYISKNYVCSICGAAFNSSSNCNIHKRRHLHKYTIRCEECGKGFYRTSDLAIHMRYHTGEKPFACSFCTQRFTRQDTLTRHMKRHSGEKPFTCQFCNAKFYKSYDLKLHHSRSKQCIKKQICIAEKKEDDMQQVLITDAFVF